MEIAWVAPGATVCTPEGDTVPFAPEDTEMVNPTVQEPEERQKGFAGSLLAHCASVVRWLVRSKVAGVGGSGGDAATAYCPGIELAAALPLAIPAAVVVAVMHPAAAGTQAAPPLSVAVAPLMGAWKVTTAPGTAA